MSERVVQLPSGLTIAVEPMISTRTASIGVWVGAGARDETRERSGISHFLEHLLFKGTESRSAIDISQTIDRLGGDINAFTSKEYTAYYCRIPARHAATGVELLGDVLTAPALRDDDIDSERQVILEELAMDDDSPEDVVHREFGTAVFGDHPLGWDTAGDRTSVRGLTAEAVRSYYAEHYVTENTVVAVAGAVDPDEVIDQVTKAFDRLPSGSAPRDRREPSPAAMQPGATVAFHDDTEQVHLVVGGRSIRRLDPDREALDIANHILGGGLSSRLFDEIRERRGLAYSVFSSAAAYADIGAWSVYAGTMPEHAADVRSLIGVEVARLVEHGITADELDIAQGYLAGSYEMGLEDSGARMSWLAGQLTILGELRSVEEQLDRWSAVSLDDVHRVVERVYGADEPVTVSVGPT
ncbi:MAG: pitrilysin family protein [Ilumatobacteraceae bacterium]|nr:pitrilysin family protein [Ilumatobacteraceae bacterium]